MPRMLPVAVVLALVPALSPAQGPLVVTVEPGEAKPMRFFSPDNAVIVGPNQTIWPPNPPHSKFGFGAHLRARLMYDNHECAPDGCPKPIGCGNHWTELKWMFGSCRQFFGTADAAVGEGPTTFVPR